MPKKMKNNKKRLSEQMVKETIYSERNFRPYGVYALICKRMPIYDEGLENFIGTVNYLNAFGVNITPILDFKLLPDTTLSYKNGMIHSTKGVFLLKKAKGVSFEDVLEMSFSVEDAILERNVNAYLLSLTNYVRELEKRAIAPLPMFEKLVEDYMTLFKENIVVNSKPGHVFFDSKNGFTFIGVLPKDRGNDEFICPTAIFDAVFGAGMPRMTIENQVVNPISSELQKRFMVVLNILQNKLTYALRKYGFSKEKIQIAKRELMKKFKIDVALNYEDIPIYLAEIQANKREQKENKKRDFTFLK